MIKKTITAALVFITLAANAQQKVIELYNGAAPGSEQWNYTEWT